ncbi:TraM recognition domain-containing protein [Aestuariivita sp.]|uniref:type IV secretory system conjugative DNA transfer family protein n=1 Tax=Aestuariivita sp. TaxID=1872407 RepID=UPI0021738F0E|nr:TraM recognition domain-containing protein [Aestuariivita sp.]MCE8005968.1 TraM recognition domain-containing protein [Aestuariivita sp.]
MLPYPVLGLAHRRYGDPAPFGITPADRRFHLYCLGQSGTGKSTMLKNLIWQEARFGQRLCLIDPHGDLAFDVHQNITRPHLYWDVSDPNCPLGYNPLQHVGNAFRPLVASGLIDALKKQWPDAWGARMEHLLRHAILALLEQPTVDLRDLMRLFVYKGFRRQVTERLTDPQVRFFWKHEFPALNYQTSADGVAPISNKLGAFLAHPTVRTALCEPRVPLRFRRTMDDGEILLINLAKGRLGADVTNVLGGLISSSILNAAFTRHDTVEDDRRPFALHIDEFHNLTTHSFTDMLSEARKYALSVTLAHQHLSQIDTASRDAILGNVGSLVLFRVGAHDAPPLARFLGPFSPADLQNQPNHRAIVWMMHQSERLRPFTAHMLPAYHSGT